jgi:hypothetical protein
MQPVSFKRHRFPPDVIRLAVWLYFRFTLSFRHRQRHGLADRATDSELGLAGRQLGFLHAIGIGG